MKEKFESVKNHIHRNRFKYGVATGIITSGYVATKIVAEWDAFLQEQNLLDEFYK